MLRLPVVTNCVVSSISSSQSFPQLSIEPDPAKMVKINFKTVQNKVRFSYLSQFERGFRFDQISDIGCSCSLLMPMILRLCDLFLVSRYHRD